MKILRTPTGENRRSGGRRVLTTVALALLLVVAGCSDGADSSDGTDLSDGDASAGEAATLAEIDTSAHERALRAAGSFTVERSFTVTRELPDDTSQRDISEQTERHVNIDGGEYFGVDRSEFLGIEGPILHDRVVYMDDEAVFERVESNDEVQYFVVEDDQVMFPTAVDASIVHDEDRLSPDIGGVSEDLIPSVGTETYEGVGVTRYEAGTEDVVDDDGSIYEFDQTLELVSYEAVFLVDDEGIVRYAFYEVVYKDDSDFDGTFDVTITKIYERTVSDVGTTTVDRPDWLDEAREAVEN